MLNNLLKLAFITFICLITSCAYQKTEFEKNFGQSLNKAKLEQMINKDDAGDSFSKEQSKFYDDFQKSRNTGSGSSSSSSPTSSTNSSVN